MRKHCSFKGVLFDLGGTLIKTLEAPKIYHRILKVCGVEASLDKIAKAHKENEKEFKMDDMAKMGTNFWIHWTKKILEKLGITVHKEALARKIDELWWDYAQLDVYPDVPNTLSRLKEMKVRIGIVTNGFKKDYMRIFQVLGWKTETFNVIVGIDDLRKAKPHKEIFLYSVRKLGLHPEEVIFVGDSVKYDYEGARKAGLYALLLNRKGENFSTFETIESLDEVLSYF
jgi:putative hydrolase of the HAD superfamily